MGVAFYWSIWGLTLHLVYDKIVIVETKCLRQNLLRIN